MTIPSEAFSYLGPIPIVLEDLSDLEGETAALMGDYDGSGTRAIRIEKTLSPTNTLLTYWHEVMHVALRDGGAHNYLNSELEETLCDILGTYLTAAMRAGHLQFPSKDTP